MERLTPENRWWPYVSVDSDRLGGKPVFRGTRVPVQAMFDYLRGGYDMATFLDHFDGVTREQAEGVLSLAAGQMTLELRAA